MTETRTTDSTLQTPSEEKPDPAQILLLVSPGREQDLLTNVLGRNHLIRTDPTDCLETGAFDVCIFDHSNFQTYKEAYRRTVEETETPLLPSLLLVPPESKQRGSATVWEVVDDIVVLPAEPREFEARVERLIRSRRRAQQLDDRERHLAGLVSDLELTQRAMEAAPIGITITAVTGQEPQIIYVNDAFETLTGYDSSTAVGNHPRFLHGSQTEPDAVQTIEAAVADGRHAATEMTNYRANGTRFVDHVEMAPVYFKDTITHFVVFHRDVTRRRLRENRLQIVNRLLRHNLRNDLNQVVGYAGLLTDELNDPVLRKYAAHMGDAAQNLVALGEKLHRAEDAIEESEMTAETVRIVDVLSPLTETVEEKGATLTLEIAVAEDLGIPHITVLAIEELVENAVVYNDTPNPRVTLTVSQESTDCPLVTFTIADNGPGIPASVRTILNEGESQLHHGDGIGLWIVSWIADLLGGSVSFDEVSDGSIVRLTVPHGIESVPADCTSST